MSARAALKRAWYALSDRPPDEVLDSVLPLGKLLLALLPAARVARLRRDVLANTAHQGLVDRLAKRELMRRYYASGEQEQRELNRREIWGSEAGVRWHEEKRQLYSDPARFENEYLRLRRAALEQLRALAAPGRYVELCEIGTGNGMFLEYLSRALDGVERFVGIDLSGDQIARNRETYAGSGLVFLHREAVDYARRERERPTIFVFAGTLECLTEAELRELLGALRERGSPTAVTLIEPVSIDLDRELESRPRGGLLYSHNYPHLLRDAGFSVEALEVEPIEGATPRADQVSLTATAG